METPKESAKESAAQPRERLGALLLQFLKFGCFTFGGGWSIVSQMQRVYVEERKTISNEDLLDLTSVGRSLPGTMIANIAFLFGYRQAGVPGGLVCVTGMVLPPLALLSVITLFYTAFRDSYWVAAAMNGIRAAVVPIILCAALPLTKSALVRRSAFVLAALALGAYLLGVGCVWLVIAGAVCGLLLCAARRERGRKA